MCRKVRIDQSSLPFATEQMTCPIHKHFRTMRFNIFSRIAAAWHKWDSRNCLPDPPGRRSSLKPIPFKDHMGIWRRALREYLADFEEMAAQRRMDAKVMKEKREREKQMLELGWYHITTVRSHRCNGVNLRSTLAAHTFHRTQPLPPKAQSLKVSRFFRNFLAVVSRCFVNPCRNSLLDTKKATIRRHYHHHHHRLLTSPHPAMLVALPRQQHDI